MKSIDDLADEMKELLIGYGIDKELISEPVLAMEIKSAIGVINRCRRFTPTEDVLYDVKYEDKILPLAITGYMKEGAEGEITHNENGINRNYGTGGKYPKDMLQDIVPLAKFQ